MVLLVLHQSCCLPRGGSGHGEGGPATGGGLAVGGVGDILVQLPFTALPHGACP